MKFLSPLLLLAVPATSNPMTNFQIRDTSGPAVIGIITYTLPECTSTSDVTIAQYFVGKDICKDTPPLPDKPQVPFQSFGTGSAYVPPKGNVCELQVYSDAGCKGQHEGFPNLSNSCQEVGIEVASTTVGSVPVPIPKVGGKSFKFICGPA